MTLVMLTMDFLLAKDCMSLVRSVMTLVRSAMTLVTPNLLATMASASESDS